MSHLLAWWSRLFLPWRVERSDLFFGASRCPFHDQWIYIFWSRFRPLQAVRQVQPMNERWSDSPHRQRGSQWCYQRPMVMQGPLDGGGPPRSPSHCPLLLPVLKRRWHWSNVTRQRPQLHQILGRAAVPGWAAGAEALIRLSIAKVKKPKVSSNQTRCAANHGDSFKQFRHFVLRDQFTHLTLNWLPARQRGSQVAQAPNGKDSSHWMEVWGLLRHNHTCQE